MFLTNRRSTPGSLDLSGSRYKQGQLTPSPPDSPLGSNPDADIRPPSCEEDIDFHRITPPKLPKSNHAPFVTNSNNVARVEPLPPPTNTNSKFMGDDLDMLEELKARAKAALMKEGRMKEGIMISSQDTNLSSTNKERKVDQILDLMDNSLGNSLHKRRHDSEGAIVEESQDNDNSSNMGHAEDSENQPLSAMLKATNEGSIKKPPPAKRLRTRSVTLEDDDEKDNTSEKDCDILSPTKSNKNPFDDEEDEEEDDNSNKSSRAVKEMLSGDEM